MPDCIISSASVMEILQFCTEPLICSNNDDRHTYSINPTLSFFFGQVSSNLTSLGYLGYDLCR